MCYAGAEFPVPPPSDFEDFLTGRRDDYPEPPRGPLPWEVRHPTWAALIAAIVVMLFIVGLTWLPVVAYHAR